MGGLGLINSINEYLICLDKILVNIPKSEKVLLEELINNSYSLIKSNNILCDIQYIDYLIGYMFNKHYINRDTFLLLGKKLETIIWVIKLDK